MSVLNGGSFCNAHSKDRSAMCFQDEMDEQEMPVDAPEDAEVSGAAGPSNGEQEASVEAAAVPGTQHKVWLCARRDHTRNAHLHLQPAGVPWLLAAAQGGTTPHHMLSRYFHSHSLVRRIAFDGWCMAV